MKNKKYILLFILLFIAILLGGICLIKNLKSSKEKPMEEYTPQEEISKEQEQEQNRTTKVSLYFVNKENKKIASEVREVSVRDIVNNPYQKLMELLISGPESEKLERVIPEDTILLGTTKEDDCVTLNLSSAILKCEKEEERQNLIQTITSTLTELTEVNSVKFLIEGATNDAFKI